MTRLPDVGAFDPHVHAGPAQDVGTADAGALEQQRGLHRARAEDHLLAGAVVHRPPARHGTHAGHTAAVEQQVADPGPGGHGEVAAPADRADERAVGARTYAVPDGRRGEPDALAVVRVDIGDMLPAHVLGGGENSLDELVVLFDHRHPERPPGAAHVRGAEIMVFHRPVGRQRALPGPPGVAACGQAVPVGRRATHPHHPVDDGRTAQALAARPILDLAIGTDRPRRVVVGVALPPEGEIEPLRDVEHRVLVTAAVLQQQHLVLRVLRQPVGQHTAGRSGTHDDVVEIHHHNPSSLFKITHPRTSSAPRP